MSEENVHPADLDDAEKLYQLGLSYLYGTDAPKDYAKAAECFKASCAKGYMPSRRELGIMYASGQGVEPDMQKAVRYLLKESRKPPVPGSFGFIFHINGSLNSTLRNFSQ